MKSLKAYLPLLLLFMLQRANSQCNPGFTFTVSGGNVAFADTTSGLGPSTSYTWNFGNGSFSTGINVTNPSLTYTSNGSYTVVMSVFSGTPPCAASFSAVITVTNACGLQANFSVNQATNGLVSFTNTSTGTLMTTGYIWNYGDGNTSTVTAGPHTYSANGTYTITLSATNNSTPACTNTFSMIITVSSYCNLNASFTYTAGPNGSYSFQSNSSGTLAGSTYTWNYGNGNSSTGASGSHSYSTNGNYTVVLSVSNGSANPACIDTVTQIITVSSVSCPLVASMSHTAGNAGLFTFSSNASGTFSGTVYYWDFGDGYFTTGATVQHQYNSAGAYIVKHIVANGGLCEDTVMQYVNVTGIQCSASAQFSIQPGSAPQCHSLVISYPWNLSAVSWSWGDGNVSNSPEASHTYSSSGSYSVCLSVTASCGSSSSYCQLINDVSCLKTLKPFVQLVGLAVAGSFPELGVYPVPCNGSFVIAHSGLKSDCAVRVLNAAGMEMLIIIREIYRDGELQTSVMMQHAPAGIYVLEVNCDEFTTRKRLIVNGE